MIDTGTFDLGNLESTDLQGFSGSSNDMTPVEIQRHGHELGSMKAVPDSGKLLRGYVS